MTYPIVETWKPVPGFEANYEVSDLGRVRSAPRPKTRGGVLKQFLRTGYLSVCLYLNGRSSFHLVHRLVLLAHIGSCPDRPHAAHRNGIQTDNRLTNLYWATPLQNAADRTAHGRFQKAMDRLRVLSDSQAAFVRANYKIIKQTDLAAMFGVHRCTIQRIHAGERYALSSLREGQGE